MRLVGIIAVFVLALTSIVEGAFLVRLSSKVSALDEQLRAQPVSAALDADAPGRRVRAGEPARLPVPRLDPKATATPSESTTSAPTAESRPAIAVLEAALSSDEGRAHLKNALKRLEDQDRQQRMVEGAKNDVEREQKYIERITSSVPLSGGERGTIQQMYASMHATRQRILDEMRTGVKSSEQADDEIDQLEDQTETAVRGLLGEERLKQMREARRAEREKARQERQQRNRSRNPQTPVPGQ
jgi:hypothetical protein